MKFKSIQILRSIAAICVVLYHIRSYLMMVGNNNNTIFKIFTEYFSLGALLFFAVSGFLMAHLIDIGYENFLIKRLLRIYPTYIIAAILCVFIKVAIFGSVAQPNLIKSLTLLPFGNIQYALNVEWTLIYEVFFYLICFLFTIKSMRYLFPYFLSVWAISIIIAGFYFNTPSLFLPTINTIFLSCFNLCFIFGGLAYYIQKKFVFKSGVINWVILFFSLFIVIIFEQYSKNSVFFAKTKYFAFALSMALIVYCSLVLLKDSKSRILMSLERFGQYSYALYLIHVPIITITFVVLKDIYKYKLDSYSGILVLVMSLTMGWLYGKGDVKIHKYLSKTMTNYNLFKFKIKKEVITN